MCEAIECCLSGPHSRPGPTCAKLPNSVNHPESKSRVLACVHRPGIQGLNAVCEMHWLGKRSLQDCCCSIPELRIAVNQLLAQLNASCPTAQSHCRRDTSSPDRPAYSGTASDTIAGTLGDWEPNDHKALILSCLHPDLDIAQCLTHNNLSTSTMRHFCRQHGRACQPSSHKGESPRCK